MNDPLASMTRALQDIEAAAQPIEPRLTVTKLTQYVPISTELLREPTDAERAEWAAQHAEDALDALAQRALYAVAIGSATNALLREVLELHRPVEDHGRWVCTGCDWDGVDGESAMWPCRTARLVGLPTTERSGT